MIIKKDWTVSYKHFTKSMVALCFIFASIFTQANEKIYRVGVEELDYYPLFNFSATDSNQPSFTQELISTFFKEYNIKFQFVVLPIKRFDKWYVDHGIDFKFPDNFRWRDDKDNDLDLTFSNPVLYLNAGTYVLKKNQHISREHIKTLSTVTGFYPTLWVDRIEHNETKLLEANTPVSVVKHVLYENTQATNIEKNVIDYHLKELGNKTDEIVLATNIKHEKFAYHLSSIHYPEIIEKFNEFLNKNPQYLKQLKAKYHIIEP